MCARIHRFFICLNERHLQKACLILFIKNLPKGSSYLKKKYPCKCVPFTQIKQRVNENFKKLYSYGHPALHGKKILCFPRRGYGVLVCYKFGKLKEDGVAARPLLQLARVNSRGSDFLGNLLDCTGSIFPPGASRLRDKTYSIREGVLEGTGRQPEIEQENLA